MVRALAAVMLLAVCLQAQAQNQVAQGQVIYQTASGHAAVPAFWNPDNACASCHFGNAAPNQTQSAGSVNHISASNNLQVILNAFGAGGVMTSYLTSPALNAADAAVRDRAFKLSLYIGQFQPPVFRTVAGGSCTDPALRMRARSGVASVQDIYPCLVADGTGGAARDVNGLLISNQVNAPSVAAASSSSRLRSSSTGCTVRTTKGRPMNTSATNTPTGV